MIEDISNRLMADFASCLQSRLGPGAAGDAPTEAKPIKGFQLFFGALLDRLRRVFRRRH